MEAGWSKLYTEHLKYRFACGLDAGKHLEYVIVDIAIQNQKSSPYRGVAQLVERVVWDHQVARSSRVTPTRKPTAIASATNNRLLIYPVILVSWILPSSIMVIISDSGSDDFCSIQETATINRPALFGVA